MRTVNQMQPPPLIIAQFSKERMYRHRPLMFLKSLYPLDQSPHAYLVTDIRRRRKAIGKLCSRRYFFSPQDHRQDSPRGHPHIPWLQILETLNRSLKRPAHVVAHLPQRPVSRALISSCRQLPNIRPHLREIIEYQLSSFQFGHRIDKFIRNHSDYTKSLLPLMRHEINTNEIQFPPRSRRERGEEIFFISFSP
jgi:hypothetical protein